MGERRPHRPLSPIPSSFPSRHLPPREAAEARLVRPTVAGRGASSRLVSDDMIVRTESSNVYARAATRRTIIGGADLTSARADRVSESTEITLYDLRRVGPIIGEDEREERDRKRRKKRAWNIALPSLSSRARRRRIERGRARPTRSSYRGSLFPPIPRAVPLGRTGMHVDRVRMEKKEITQHGYADTRENLLVASAAESLDLFFPVVGKEMCEFRRRSLIDDLRAGEITR